MKRVLLFIVLSILFVNIDSSAQVSERKGWWKFDDGSNLLKAENGNALELVGSHTAIEGPQSGNGAVTIGIGSYYKLVHGIAANGGGTKVNNYSLQFDFRIKSVGSWKTFFQLNSINDDDGECFINTNGNIGVGATGYSDYAITANEWYRLVVSVKNGKYYKYYLDGHLLKDGIIQEIDGRFSMESSLLIFGDNDGDDGEIDCAELAIWDQPLTASQALELGGYGHNLPMTALQPAGLWKFDDPSSLVESYYGKDLTLVGTHESVDGPTLTDKAVRIGVGSHYEMFSGLTSNGGGSKINEYTLKFDFKVKDISTWRAFYQTTVANTDDADCFINTSGQIGTGSTGYGAYKLNANEWYRFIISVKNGTHYRYYLDGQLLLEGNVQEIDGRFSFTDPLLLLADNDGEDAEMDVAEIAFWDRALNGDEVPLLAGFGHDLGGGGTQENALVGHWKFDNSSSPLAAEPNLGKDLVLVGSHSTISGPADGNGAVKIGPGSHYKMEHGIKPNGGGLKVNEYSLQIDFRIPALDGWHCFFQLNPNNNDDGDLFINTNGNIGTGALGYSSYAVKQNEWYRLVLSVKNGTQYLMYLDGQLMRQGNIQGIDGRYSLDNLVLLFADEDGEDREIDVAEVAIWNYALSQTEIAALGGYGHQTTKPPTRQLVLVPYLQTPQPNSIYVCWHDTLATLTQVEYGTTESLGSTKTGTSEIIAGDYRWHSVKLTDLQPNTQYFYRLNSGSGNSQIYSFKTLPGSNYTGKIRFLLFSDTHNNDTTMAKKIQWEAKKKIQQLYGDDIQNHINFILHSGDLVVDGSNIVQWTDQYFAVMSKLSPWLPIMTVTGNHEIEHPNYYNYMKYDDFSTYPSISTLNERFWSFTVGNTLFIGLNSNISATNAGDIQKSWLEQRLTLAQADTTIDFVFIIVHHFPITELWGEGITFDAGPSYITNKIIPVLKRYTKVIQLSYGHTHGFERGTIETMSQPEVGDFRIVCGGGGGGAIDRWGAYKNNDYPNIHVTIDNFHYQLIEIDVAAKTFESKMFSLGNTSFARDNEVMDSWYKKVKQPAPAKPSVFTPNISKGKIILNSSAINSDSLMTIRIQISKQESFATTVIDTMVHWKNVYGADAQYNPIDKNKGLDLTKLSFNQSRFDTTLIYYYRVRYRDHNLKWSDWSDSTIFKVTTDVEDETIPKNYSLEQNFPNPFNPTTKIAYSLPKSSHVVLKIFDILGNEVKTLVDNLQSPGKYEVIFDAHALASGVYIYQLQAADFSSVKKLILLK